MLGQFAGKDEKLYQTIVSFEWLGLRIVYSPILSELSLHAHYRALLRQHTLARLLLGAFTPLY
jgi:hypothetical protein